MRFCHLLPRKSRELLIKKIIGQNQLIFKFIRSLNYGNIICVQAGIYPLWVWDLTPAHQTKLKPCPDRPPLVLTSSSIHHCGFLYFVVFLFANFSPIVCQVAGAAVWFHFCIPIEERNPHLHPIFLIAIALTVSLTMKICLFESAVSSSTECGSVEVSLSKRIAGPPVSDVS